MATVPSAPQIQVRPWPANTTIDFYWSPPASDGGSAITKYTLSAAAIAYTQDISANVSFYQVTGLTPQTSYTFQLTATNGVGESAAATFRTVQTGGAPTVPSGAALTASIFQNSNVALLSWTPSTATGQAVLRGYRIRGEPVSQPLMSSFTWNVYPFVTSNLRPNLSTNVTYQFSIEGVNDVGYGFPRIYSSTLSFITDTITTSNLTMHFDSRSNNSYPGSGTTWSNVAPTYSTINYTLVGATVSTIVANGTSNRSIFFNSNYIAPTANMNAMRNAGSCNETREFWLYWNGTAGTITSEEQAGSPNSGWSAYNAHIAPNLLKFAVYSNAFLERTVSTGVMSNQWYHIVFQYSATSNLMLGYVNGVQTLNSNTGRQHPASYYVLFGAAGGGNSNMGQFGGAIPVIRYYNRVLSSNEVQSNYNAQRSQFGV